MRVRENFRLYNAEALSSYAGERAERYAALKFEGLQTAPVQFAVFCERATSQGHRLGRLTMPETLECSVVAAVSSFWLAAGLWAGRRLGLHPRSRGDPSRPRLSGDMASCGLSLRRLAR